MPLKEIYSLNVLMHMWFIEKRCVCYWNFLILSQQLAPWLTWFLNLPSMLNFIIFHLIQFKTHARINALKLQKCSLKKYSSSWNRDLVGKNCKSRKLFHKLNSYSGNYLFKGLTENNTKFWKRKANLEARLV